MKHLPYILLLVLFSCKQPKQAEAPEKTISEITKEKDTLIFTPNADTLKVTTAEYQEIATQFAFINESYPDDPQFAYYCNGNTHRFGSENGQDRYFTFYAHFLQKRNGIEKFATERKKLVGIYRNINSLFGYFQYGGTYFGHQWSRIPGYAEYTIFKYSKKLDDFEKTYDITKEKTLYIQSLRQLVDDEISIDANTHGKEKTERIKMLNGVVDEIDSSITDTFYLRAAQEFQYGHYIYY